MLQSIHFHAQSWLPARSIVVESIAARQDIDSSGEIVVLKKSCPVSDLAATRDSKDLAGSYVIKVAAFIYLFILSPLFSFP